MYPEGTDVPEVGEGLNKSATIVFYNWTLPRKYIGALGEYKEKLRRWAESRNAEFLYYDPDNAEFSIRVESFS